MKFSPRLEDWRLREGPFQSNLGDTSGAFKIPGPAGRVLVVIASDGKDGREPDFGWEHVSVSATRNVPSWPEMDFVKRMFWDDEECVVQYHPPRSQWVNNHPNVLHLWRWNRGEFPMPSPLLVGVKEFGEIKTPEQARRLMATVELLSRESENDL